MLHIFTGKLGLDLLRITDLNQACFTKMSGCGVQEVIDSVLNFQ